MAEPRSDEPFSRVGPGEARSMIEKGVRVLDVREPQEYAETRIADSTLVPLGTLLSAPRDILTGGPVLFVCSEGIRSAVACEAAAAIGLEEVYNLEGGTQRWEAEGYPVESGQGAEGLVAEARVDPEAVHHDFMQSGERLMRVHRFRLLRAVTCALGTLDLLIEETLGEVKDPTKRCVARPDHPVQVARPELTVYGESVEEAVRGLIEKLRGRRAQEIFLPTG